MSKSIEVVATANGYYGNKHRVPGERFMIDDEKAFSKVWMERASKSDVVETRRVNTGGTDGVVGAEVPKPGSKLSAKERIAAANSASGRTDIKTASEADTVLAALAASTGSDNDDRSRDFASDPADNAAPAADWDAPADNSDEI